MFRRFLTVYVGTRNKIATAATNGAIIIWDLNKSGRKTGKQLRFC